MNKVNLPAVIIGTGGSSKETYYIVKKINDAQKQEYLNVLGFIGQDPSEVGREAFDGQKIIGTDDMLPEIALSYAQIGIILPLADPRLKETLYLKYKQIPNAVFPNVVHPSAIFEGEIDMGIGNIISAGCILACDLKLGNFNLLNRSCTTGHDVILGDYNTVNPSAVISGNVTVMNKCLLGAGSIVLQGLAIENGVILGAGAVLTKDAKEGETMVGIPADRFVK